MKLRPLLILLAALSAVSLAVAAEPAADPQLSAILEQAKPIPYNRTEGSAKYLRRTERQAVQLRELALPYLASHPSGPERAKVVLALASLTPRFVKEFKEGFDEKPSADAMVIDEKAAASWKKELAEMVRGVRADPGVTPEQRVAALKVMARFALSAAETPDDIAKVQAMLVELAADPASMREVAMLQSSLLYNAASMGVKDYRKYLEGVAALPHPELAKVGKEAIETLKNQIANIGKIKFTAVDGREVDLNAMRGKVVLVDFWATWCGPCVKEIPNVIANYRKYHDRGFEVVGISFENSGLIDQETLERMRRMNADAKLDTPEVAAEKLQKAKEKLVAFTREKNMPWPQQFDGKHWSNEFGRMFNIRAIPAVFLIDQKGNLINTSAHGEALSRELARLFGT